MTSALIMFTPITLAMVLVVAAALTLVFVFTVTLRSALQVSSGGETLHQMRPLDLDAFRNLTDPAEDDYLRRQLSPPEYRVVQRLRLKAMAAYVQIAGQNAAQLIHVGTQALYSRDPQTTAAAKELIDNALLLRRNAAFVLLRLYLAWIWPNAGFTASPVLDSYRRMSGAAMLLGRLQDPSTPIRIAAS